MELSELKELLKKNYNVIQSMRNDKSFTWSKVCETLGLSPMINPEYVRGVFRNLNKTNVVTSSSIVQTENETTISTTVSKPVTSLEELISVCKIDTNKYKITKWICNHWAGKYQVKAFLSLKEEGLSELDEFFKNLHLGITPIKYSPSTVKEENLLVLGLYDVHFDKMSYDNSTTFEKELNKYHNTAIDLVEKSSALCNISDVWIPIGNDFFNTDTLFNTTTRGTQQSVTGNWTDVFKAAVTMYRSLIHILLSKGINTKLIWAPGNHDYQKSFYLCEVLAAMFPELNVDSSDNYFKIYKYGNTALGFTHGDYASKQLPLMFASKARDIWGQTKYAEILTGHIHTNKKQSFLSVDEIQGVQIRTLPALSVTDAWSKQNMYDDNLKRGVGLIYNLTHGKTAEIFSF